MLFLIHSNPKMTVIFYYHSLIRLFIWYYVQNSWHELATSFSTEKTLILLDTAHQVRSLSPTIYYVVISCFLSAISFLLQRSLAQTLVRSASGIRNSDASSQWVFTSTFFCYVFKIYDTVNLSIYFLFKGM